MFSHTCHILNSCNSVFCCCLDPKVSAPYKMEVLRDPESKLRPLFRVTVEGGEQVGFYYTTFYFFIRNDFAPVDICFSDNLILNYLNFMLLYYFLSDPPLSLKAPFPTTTKPTL